MNKFKLINVAFALCLTACGSGNKSQTPTQAPIVEQPPIQAPLTTYYHPNAPQAGDSYTYQSRTGDGILETYSYTDQVGLINDDGSFYIHTFDGLTHSKLNARLLDSKRNIIKNYGCNNSPAQNLLPFPWYVGEISRQNIVVTCAYDPIGSVQKHTISTTTKVINKESISVAAGTFDTLKMQIIQDELNLLTVGQTISSHEEMTCWYDLKSGFVVKCTSVLTFDLSKVDATSVFGQMIISSLSREFHTSKELTSTAKASDFSFLLTGSLNNVAIADLYLTPNKSQQFNINTKNSFKFETTQPVLWSITSSTGTTQLGSDLGVVVDGVPVTLHTSDKGLTATVSDPVSATSSYVNLRITATLISDPTKTVSVDVTINTGAAITPSPIPALPSNCFGQLKFC